MNVRETDQRHAIHQVIQTADGPLHPNQILQLASQKVPKLGIATVYRNIRRMLDAGRLHAVTFASHDVRYEPANAGHHHHFLCRTCGEAFIIHACPGGISRLAPAGFEVEGHDVTLYGRCSRCSRCSRCNPHESKGHP